MVIENYSMNDFVNKITRSDRSPLVRDQQVGLISVYQLNEYDESVLAQVEYYSDGVKSFENYDELDRFLEEVFIPSNIHTKVNRGNLYGENYFSIQFNKIAKLRLSDDEIKHVMNYLGEHGIIVCGNAVMPEGEFDNYDYNSTYKSGALPGVLDKCVQENLFKMLNDESLSLRDRKKVRNKLIERNVRLVDYVLFKMHRYYDISIDEYRTYGYEGLIYAVEHYDCSLGYAFSTYAYKCIYGFVQRYIGKNSGIAINTYFDFLKVQKIVEEELGKKYVVGDFEMLNEILDFLVSIGKISKKQSVTIRLIEVVKSMESNYLEITEIQDYITCESEYSTKMFDYMDFEDLKEQINWVLGTLTVREKEVLCLFFGLNCDKLSLEEIGVIFMVTRERIRQILYKALRKLRHPSRSNHLKSYKNCVFNVSDELGVARLIK